MIETTNTELKMISKAAREFARKALQPNWEENDRYPYGNLYNTILDKAFEAGFLQTTLPDDSGNPAKDIKSLCIILHQVCQEDASMGAIIFTNAVVQELIIAAGGFDLIREKTEKASSSEEFIMAYPIYCNPGELEKLPEVKKGNDGDALSPA